MDYNHADHFNDLLSRKCSCGAAGEMLVDFVADFVVRCTKCHKSTHAYINPHDAANHWNNGDDIMEDRLDIFWDNPESVLQGDLKAIYVDDEGFFGISKQSSDFEKAIIEYADKKFAIQHEFCGETGKIDIEELSSFDREAYKRVIRPQDGESICFTKITFSENRVDSIAYRWGNTWLFIFADEYNLILTRSNCDLSNPDSPQVDYIMPQLWE